MCFQTVSIVNERVRSKLAQQGAGNKGKRAELKVCSSTRNLERGKQIHAEAKESGNDTWINIATALVKMYAKCGSMADAQQVFDQIKRPDAMSWNALMMGYAENGESMSTLDLFARMKSQSCAPTSITYVAALKACASLALKADGSGKAEWLKRGKLLHSEIGGSSNIYVQSTLIDMYAKCGCMVDARHVFDSMKHPEVVSWNALMLGYAENGEGITALDLFSKMKSEGCAPTSVNYVAALKACTSLALKQDEGGRAECLKRGKQIHSEIDCQSNIYVQSTLIDMYAKCGRMVGARQVFNGIKHPEVVSWNALIMGYSDSGEGVTALGLFEMMKSRGCAPNSVTYVAALKACTSLITKQDIAKRGKQIHIEIGCHLSACVQNTLMDMYAKCGRMSDAHKVFDSMKQADVVSWNSLIMGYADNGHASAALGLFVRMKSHGYAPDPFTFVGALKACSLLGALECGSKIHAEIRTRFDIGTECILVNCLVDFYAKCGNLVEAQKVFDLHPGIRNLITWNALLGGYCRLGDHNAV